MICDAGAAWCALGQEALLDGVGQQDVVVGEALPAEPEPGLPPAHGEVLSVQRQHQVRERHLCKPKHTDSHFV